jgi:hypothetical protein
LERKRVGSERGGRYDLRSGSTLIGHHAVKLAHDLNGYRFVSPSLAPHDYTALPEHEIETEVDRYIAWPQQALSYYMGELEIVLAREKAEKPLGANGADGISNIEGKVARVAASKLGNERVSNSISALSTMLCSSSAQYRCPSLRRASIASSPKTAEVLTRIWSE